MENPFNFLKKRNRRMKELKEETGMSLLERAKMQSAMSGGLKGRLSAIDEKLEERKQEKAKSRQQIDMINRLKKIEKKK